MPNVPIPPQANISGANWNDAFNPSGIGQGAGAVGAPVNATMSGLNQAGLQATQALQKSQAANALTEVQQKTRGMQASMLGALAQLPPDQYEAQKASVIGTVNKLNPSFQYDPNMDQATAKMNAMSAVPVQEQPIYGLNQQIPKIMDQMSGMLGAPSNGSAPEQNGQGGPGGTPLGGQVSPEVMAKMSLVPALKPVVDNLLRQQEINQNSPTLRNTAEANKNSIESVEGYNQVKASLGSLKDVIGSTDENGKFVPNEDLPQTRGLLTAEQRAELAQRFGAPAGEQPNAFGTQKSANDFKTFNLLNSSQTLKAIQSLAASGQIKPTKTLENIIDRGYLVDPEAVSEEKWRQANIVQKELENSSVAAQNIAKTMGGGQTQEMTKPVTASAQAQAKLPQKPASQSTPIVGTQAAYDALPSGSIYAEPDGKKYRKP